MSGRVWRRLRIIEVGRDEAEKLRQYADLIERQPDPHESIRRGAAEYLRRLADCPAALAAIAPKYARRSLAPDMALDYLVRRELLGKAAAAHAAVAKDWGVSVATVKDAYTDHKTGAVDRLKRLVDDNVGRLERGMRQPDGSYTEVHWTRARLLAAVRDDLLDHRREIRSRKKSR